MAVLPEGRLAKPLLNWGLTERNLPAGEKGIVSTPDGVRV